MRACLRCFRVYIIFMHERVEEKKEVYVKGLDILLVVIFKTNDAVEKYSLIQAMSCKNITKHGGVVRRVTLWSRMLVKRTFESTYFNTHSKLIV